MVLGLLIGLGITKAACNAASVYSKAACPDLDEKDFDLQNMANGINPNDVYKIAARCGVRPKNDVLPYFGYKDCLTYVRKYANNPSDVDKFIKAWKREVNKKEKVKSYILKNNSKSEYDDVVRSFKNNYKISKTNIILTYNHWTHLLPEEHKERVQDMYENTYMGQRAVKPPIIRFDPHVYGKRTEVWVVQANEGDKQDDRQTKSRWGRLYAACCKIRGYQP